MADGRVVVILSNATDNSTQRSGELFDTETGEKKCCGARLPKTDKETGEPLHIDLIVERKTFQVPVEYLREHPNERREFKARRRFTGDARLKTDSSMRSGTVKTVFLSESRRVNPLVFVLPSFLLFPTWASIVCLLWEACMHIWSHRRNRRKNRQVEYRSPFHLLSSQFCIRCRTRKWKQKVKEIHEKRTMKKRLKKQKTWRMVS